MRRGWLARLVLVEIGVLAGLLAWRAVGAGCDELSIWKTSPYEQTDCTACEDSVSGRITNSGWTQLTCIHLSYSYTTNIAAGGGLPELWFENEQTVCGYVPPFADDTPGAARFFVFSKRTDWNLPASMTVFLGFPCMYPFTKSFTATWTTTCPYCND
ncbi:MAG: hypothetical protein JXP34_08580 [Planctomycetes bacterium]|nr:hypothetical protein [Planctomycetota bacterium]